MRPRVLTVTAFGPYAGTEVVDFRPLRGRDLFLIEGPNGAGKTILFDALCYALYGVVPGARDQVKGELRSAWADPRVKCSVELEFEVGDRIYRALRSPAQARVKKRGGGMTAERPEAHLLIVDAEGVGVPICPPRVAEVDLTVTRLLGLDAEQFKQVLLLPQGEMRRMLLATSAEKETLLEQLFGTAIYKELALQLGEDKLALERRAAELERAVADTLGARGAASPAELEARMVALGERVEDLGRSAEAAGTAAAAARSAHARAAALAARFVERGRLACEAEALAEGEPRIASARRRIEEAVRAGPLAPLLADAAAAAELSARRGREGDARAGAAGVAASEAAAAAEAAAELPALRAELDALAATLATLAALEPVEQSAAAAAAETSRLEAGAARLRGRVAERQKALAAADERLVTVDRDLAAALVAARDETALATVAGQLGALLDDRRALANLAVATAAALVERDRLAARLAAARARQEATLAAELAAGLVPGAPCPVCGSAEHPAPANAPVIADGPGPSLAELTEQLLAAGARLARLEGDQAATETRVTALAAALGDLAARDLVAEAERAVRAAAAARTAAQTAARLGAERPKLQVGVVGLREELAALDATLAEAERTVAVAAARAADLRARVEAQVPGGGVPARRAAETRRRDDRLLRAERLEAAVTRTRAAAATEARLLEEARRFAAEARLAHDEAAAALARALVARGFADEAAVRAALVPEDELAVLRRDVEAWEARRTSVQARLQSVDAELAGQSQPVVDELATAAAEAERRAGELRVALGETRAGLAEAQRARVRAGELAAQLDGTQRELAGFARLARLVGGDNRLRMSLGRYVLANRIDEIAAVASERLMVMSRGRYRLRRTDEVRHGARGSGLDLVVEDRMTGQDRSVQSLSGGEQFIASLSLALALADTVQAHAGGVRLDSLFIDEGFGSLDDESLDLVLRTLEDLRAGGRLVGVISHVPELHERLATRLTVKKGARGSTTELTL